MTTRIGELAEQLGLTARTLRYWEQRGLLPAAERTRGGYRAYGEAHRNAARGVLRLKMAGMSLDEIRDIQSTLHDGPSALHGMASIDAHLASRQEELRGTIAAAQALLDELEAARRCVQLCDGCDGKVYDAECVACLQCASGNVIPDSLECLMNGSPAVSEEPPPGR